MKYRFYLGILSLAIISCADKPKVISPSETTNTEYSQGESTGVFDKNNSLAKAKSTSPPSTNGTVHHVKVLEVLPTEKYVYLRVSEEEEEYWVATGKQTIDIGKNYFFRDGLLKTNFESKEYNRMFDKVYLVSKLVPENHAHQNTPSVSPSKNTIASSPARKKIKPIEGSMSIKEVVEQASSLQGTEVQLTAECTKLNANIMGRNWIHLKDGSKDDYDFIVTSDQAIPEGHIVTLKGTVGLDRDFGSGYKYDLLIENATVIRE